MEGRHIGCGTDGRNDDRQVGAGRALVAVDGLADGGEGVGYKALVRASIRATLGVAETLEEESMAESAANKSGALFALDNAISRFCSVGFASVTTL